MSDSVKPSIATLAVERRDVGSRVVLAIEGEIDLATSPTLRAAVEAALDSGAHELWIDLCATTFMDSTGLHVLVDAHNRSERLRRRLTIICPPGAVRRVFDITGFARTLRVYGDLAHAQQDA